MLPEFDLIRNYVDRLTLFRRFDQIVRGFFITTERINIIVKEVVVLSKRESSTPELGAALAFQGTINSGTATKHGIITKTVFREED